MTGSIDRPARFDPDDVEVILRRAAELQASRSLASGPDAGLSLPELEEIAAEAGIDPAFVRQAAQELRWRPRARGLALLLGAPTRVQAERRAAGPVSRSTHSLLVLETERAIGEPGQAGAVGDSWVWRSNGVRRAVAVSVTPRTGETRLRIEERLHGIASALFGGLIGGVGLGGGLGIGLGVGLAALDSALFALAAPAVTLIGSYLLARMIYRMTAERRARDLSALANRMAGLLEPARPDSGGASDARGTP